MSEDIENAVTEEAAAPEVYTPAAEPANLTGLTIKDLLDAGLHFGHQTRRWNPKMKPYIFDKRNGIHIIDLTQSVVLLEEAAKFLRETVLSGKKVLFVATKKQAQEVVKEAATNCNQLYMTERWLGGTLTNNQTIRRSVRRMRQIEAIAKNNNGVLSPFKKEASNLRRELEKLQANLSGIADMDKMPGALVVFDVCREKIAVSEAGRLHLPIVAVVDSNADPDPVDYVVPGNDDAIRAIKLIADAFSKVIKDADEEWSRISVEREKAAEAQRRAEAEARRESEKAAEAQRRAEAEARREKGEAPEGAYRPRRGGDRRPRRGQDESKPREAAAAAAAAAAAPQA